MKKHAAEAPKPASKLGFFALIAIVVGSMLGGGVYSLPQNTSLHAAVSLTPSVFSPTSVPI